MYGRLYKLIIHHFVVGLTFQKDVTEPEHEVMYYQFVLYLEGPPPSINHFSPGFIVWSTWSK